MFIFVFQTKDDVIHVGESSNACKSIAAWNSNNNLQIERIIGVKEKNSERTIKTVVKKFSDAGKTVSMIPTERAAKIQKTKRRKSAEMDVAIAEAVAKD